VLCIAKVAVIPMNAIADFATAFLQTGKPVQYVLSIMFDPPSDVLPNFQT
jgi:hypothetical protein